MEGAQRIPVWYPIEMPSKPIIITLRKPSVDEDLPCILIESCCDEIATAAGEARPPTVRRNSGNPRPFGQWPESLIAPAFPILPSEGSDSSVPEAKNLELLPSSQQIYLDLSGSRLNPTSPSPSPSPSSSSSSSSSPISDFSNRSWSFPSVCSDFLSSWKNNISESPPGLPIGMNSASCPPSPYVSPSPSPLLEQCSRMSSFEDLDLERLLFGPGDTFDLPPGSPTPSASPSPSIPTTPFFGCLADTERLKSCDFIRQNIHTNGPSSGDYSSTSSEADIPSQSFPLPSTFELINRPVSAPAYPIHHFSLDFQDPWGGGQPTVSEQEVYSDQSNRVEPRPPDILPVPGSCYSLDWQNSYGWPSIQGVDTAGVFLTGPLSSRATHYADGDEPQPSIPPSASTGRKSDHFPDSLTLPSDIHQPPFRRGRCRSEILRSDLTSGTLQVTTTRNSPYSSRSRSRTRPEVQVGFRSRVSSELFKKKSEERRTTAAPYQCPDCFDTFTRSDGLRDHIERHKGNKITSQCDHCKEQKTTISRHMRTCAMNPNRQPAKPSKKKARCFS